MFTTQNLKFIDQEIGLTSAKAGRNDQSFAESISKNFRFGLVWCFDIKPKRNVHIVHEHWNLWQSAKISQIWTFSVSTNYQFRLRIDSK